MGKIRREVQKEVDLQRLKAQVLGTMYVLLHRVGGKEGADL